MIKLTGLWLNQSKDGKKHLSGNLSSGARILVLPNEFKKSDNDPDYHLLVAPRLKKEREDTTEDDVPF